MTRQEQLGKKLRIARLENGLSLMDLAKATGMSKSQVWEIEQGECNANVFYVQDAAKALGTTVNKLLSK